MSLCVRNPYGPADWFVTSNNLNMISITAAPGMPSTCITDFKQTCHFLTIGPRLLLTSLPFHAPHSSSPPSYYLPKDFTH